MAYQPHNFQEGEVLTSNALNEMDLQIKTNSATAATAQAALEEAQKIIEDKTAIPAGGEKGQSLVKASGDDYDLEWGEASGGTVNYRTQGQTSSPIPVNADTLGGRLAEEYELKTDHRWKKLGDFVGTAVADISAIVANGADEILLTAAFQFSPVHEISATAIVSSLSANRKYCLAGWRDGFCTWSVTNGSITVQDAIVNGTSYKTSVVWTIYYR